MGRNQGWEIAEKQIIGLYDLGSMTAPALDVICKAFSGTDIDPGGQQDLKTADGKDMYDIFFELVMPDFVSDDDTEWWEVFSEYASTHWGWR